MASPREIITIVSTTAWPRGRASSLLPHVPLSLCPVFNSLVLSSHPSNHLQPLHDIFKGFNFADRSRSSAELCFELTAHCVFLSRRISSFLVPFFVGSAESSLVLERVVSCEFRHFVAMASERKIMVAVDDSEVSAYAFTWALHNLVRKTDHVVALTAAPFVDITYPSTDLAAEYGPTVIPSAVDTEVDAKNVTTDAKELIAKCISQCKQADIPCTGEVVKGDAGTWIVDEANRLGADVIVVGSRGIGVIKRAIMGSNSDYVLHNATCPVAIVRHSEEDLNNHDPLNSSGGSRKIVIAVDQSREAVYAFKWALENFANEEDKVILYHVNQSVPPVTTAGTGEFGIEEVYIPSDSPGKTEVEALDDSEKLVEKYMQYAAKETKIKCEGVVVTGQPEYKVVEGLTNLQADAVIIGTHDRSALSRTLLSSITDYLAHNSPCPLIVARMPKVPESPGTESAPDHKRTT